ncbi:WSC domain-containing protein [Cadophora sp. MPI-SDFR-AT-0126]|nr:WSC domain-containing protein [Leotiomycetes sp. MPI-SDFR-AT-0126]
MKSFFSVAALTALFAATNVMALERTAQGCFSSSTGLKLNSSIEYNSRGSCGDVCYAQNSATFAMTNKNDCYCGDVLPPASTKVDDTKCNINCPGFGSESCGSKGYWSVYVTGIAAEVENAPAAASDTVKSSTASATSTGKPSVVTVGGETVVVTAGSQSTSATSSGASSGGSGPSKAGIAAGVVVGVVAIAAIAGGAFLFIRNRKRKAIEEEYKRNAAVSSFIAGGKPPSSSGGASSFNDMRLDPAVMAQRRMSDGSIADNQDYSRRILKVTNA